MPRQPDPSRKPQLIGEILDYLLDKPLSTLSFRTIASALGVSTYTLVYHFGSRAELITEIVSAISSRIVEVNDRLRTNPGEVDVYFGNLESSWQWTVDPRNRQLQRLEFEAGMLEAIEPGRYTFSRALHENWRHYAIEALQALGLDPQDARAEGRLMVDCFFGIQYDFVVSGDAGRCTEAFRSLLDAHRERLERLLGRPLVEQSSGG
ncbi:TetR/AcrR family transcriptional regulator [Galbitalea soli]|uniref:TetR/AcrR family transcriptional regulator n=1 Tax=Galbitalea soli TaxID=1268042 RepID=A0A7C9TQH2_9MICO|nr:TetR/AcrR family transcriptional regulator [Galbitalea soli]NEM90702.1 TetR/AcrR family transcriptional regulator [Galbitalea soli]NYJ31420.1 AcrR family transcriptional regulator [Galbitalea soli]